MGKIKTIARRSFLIGSAAIAGGVAFGAYKIKTPHANPLLSGLNDGEAALTPYVKITKDAVTLIAPHTDIGQGVRSAQAALIAEELDIEFGQFEIDPGAPDAAYYNKALGDELFPQLPTAEGFKSDLLRGTGNAVTKLLGMQVTGGSSSMPDSFDKLRSAGAVARETLKAAAAKKTGIDITELTTSNGAVHLPDGAKLQYTELADIASEIKPVENVDLRDPSEWRLIGKEMKRIDIVGKSTGTLDYGIDLVTDDMVYAALQINPRQNAGVKSFDVSDAKAMRGVIRTMSVTNGVAVIADNTWRAFQAADAITCEWEEAPYPAEQDDHWAEVAASFTEEHLDKEWRNEGDVESTEKAIEVEYKTPYVAHAPLEPLSALCTVTDERVDIWVCHQMPRFAQAEIAKITGHDAGDIHLHNQYSGGSFGHRLEFENVKYAAEIANQMRDTPVKLTYKREVDMVHDFPRQIGMARGTGSVKDGQVESYDIQIATVSASRSQFSRIGFPASGPDVQIVAGAWNLPYAFENFRVRGYAVPELAPTSSWRSVGASSAGFVADCLLDELIHEAGADPLAERIRLCNNDHARKVLEAVGEMSNWGSDLGPNRGRGIAFVESFGVPVAEVIEVTNTPDGIKIDKVFVAAEVGTIVDPVNFENNVQGGVIWGLGHAMNCETTYSDGQAEQENFYDFEGMRMRQCPIIEVRGLENGNKVHGIGEPPVPPAAPALANAIFAATGQRIREMPFNKHIDFI